MYNERMKPRTIIGIGAAVGSTAGAYLPLLWGAGLFSSSSVILTTVGGFAGVWLGYKLSRY
jgi:hypothetical protein